MPFPRIISGFVVAGAILSTACKKAEPPSPWVPVYTNWMGNTISLDTTTLTKDSLGIPTLPIRVDMTDSIPLPFDSTRTYNYAVFLMSVDCSRKVQQTHEFTLFKKDGDEVSHAGKNAGMPTPWSSVTGDPLSAGGDSVCVFLDTAANGKFRVTGRR